MLSDKNIRFLNLLIPYVPYYGEFRIFAIAAVILQKESGDVIENTDDLWAQTGDITDHLVENGFAIRRRDVNLDGQSIELTERGRWLKEKGSYEIYKEYQKEKKRKQASEEIERQAAIDRNKQMNRLTSWIAVFTGVSAIDYLFEISKWFFHHMHWKLPF